MRVRSCYGLYFKILLAHLIPTQPQASATKAAALALVGHGAAYWYRGKQWSEKEAVAVSDCNRKTLKIMAFILKIMTFVGKMPGRSWSDYNLESQDNQVSMDLIRFLLRVKLITTANYDHGCNQPKSAIIRLKLVLFGHNHGHNRGLIIAGPQFFWHKVNVSTI